MADMRGKLDNTFCQAFLWSTSILEVLSIFISYWLLTLRIIALYKSKPVIVWFLYIALFASYFTSLGLLIQALRVYSHMSAYLPSFNLCVALGRPPSLQAVFEAPLVMETLIFALTVWHAWKDYRSQESNRVQMMPLMKIMYRDGVFYFCVMVAIRVWNIWVFATRPIYEMYVGIYIMWALTTTLACRIYLNIVREARRGHTTSSLPSASAQTSRPQVPHFKSGYWQATTLDSSHAQDQHMNVMWKGNTFEMNSVDDAPLKRAQSGHVLDIR